MAGQGKQGGAAQFEALKPAIQSAEAALDWARVVDLLAPVLTAAPGEWPVGAYLRLAQSLEKLDRRDAASDLFAKVRALFPAHVAGWRGGARHAQLRKDWAEAATLWRHCITHFATEQEEASWVGLSNALRRLGQVAEAEEAFAILRERWPGNWQGWAGPAQLAGDAGSWSMAARMWTACAQRFAASDPPGLSVNLCSALIRAGRTDEAAAEIARLRQRDDASGRWITLRVELLLALGDPQTAAAEIRDCAAHPAFPTCCTPEDLAGIALEMGYDAAQARDWLQGRVDIAAALTAAADRNWTKPEADRDEKAAVSAHDVTMNRHWVAEYQRALRAFIGRRTCGNFTRFVKVAVAYLPRRKIEGLLALAEKRFPQSRVRRQLNDLVHGPAGDIVNPYADFDPAWRKCVPHAEVSIAAQLAGRPWRRLVCVLMVCNEDEMLPVFVQHHRKIGVESFVIIDNNSTRPPSEVLGDLPGLDITYVNAPFSFRESGNGMAWVNEVLDAQICDWVLFADCDELLIYPGSDTIPLPRLLDHLDAAGEDVLPGLMVDLYDPAYLAEGKTSGDLGAHTLFCASQDLAGDLRMPGRGVVNRKRPPGVITPTPNKAPLVKGSAGVRYTGNHTTTVCKPSATTAVLLHYKVFRDRELVGLAPQEVMNHPRIRDRQTSQFDRHLNNARIVVDTAFDHPFHVPLSEERLLHLGYMTADPGWRRLVGHPLAADRKAPAVRARAGLTYAGKFGSFNYPFTDASLTEVLTHLRLMAAAGQRGAIRGLLNAQCVRFGRPEIALGLLLVAAVLLDRRVAAQRLFDATCRAVEAAGDKVSLAALGAIADALDDQPERALTLLTLAARARQPDPGLAARRGTLLCNARQFSQALAAMEGINPADHDRALHPFLEASARLARWDQYRQTMDAALADTGLQPTPMHLYRVAMCPDAAWRQSALDRLALRLQNQIDALDGRTLSTCLAALHLTGRHDRLVAAEAEFGHKLPGLARTYFKRLLASRAGAKPVNRVWGLGLSKSGTSSLHEYATRLGLLSAHWTNPFLGTLLSREDCDIFDVVSDTPVTWIARNESLPRDRAAIGTRRGYDSWAKSFLGHFSRDLSAPDASFDTLRRLLEADTHFPYGTAYVDLHRDLYFRFTSLREAYEYHDAWTQSLARSGRLLLDLPLETPDPQKASLVARFLGINGTLPAYPHSNKAKVALAD